MGDARESRHALGGNRVGSVGGDSHTGAGGHLGGALGDLAAKEGDALFWVLGIDMAHMGRRYGDLLAAYADRGEMSRVAERDRQRIDCINLGDAKGFWDLVQERHDDLKWCGSSPLYTFLKVAPQARGELNHYEQWNIDEQSVVSFAGISFSKES